jgi:phosphoglycolate phosphatase-like HAD superfamily hydrolase
MGLLINTIIWDFDGVLINSNEIRTLAFAHALNFLNDSELNNFLKYHESNGGLSRYKKLDWLEKEINVKLDKALILDMYGKKCVSEILKIKPLITQNIDIIASNPQVSHYIASGSDQSELRFLCKSLNIEKYFVGIYGSPKPKIEIVSDILFLNKKQNTYLVGDSINDFDAAASSDIYFIPFNLCDNLPDYNKIKSYKWFLETL